MPVLNKTYSDIRFFLKNAETKRAFVDIPFTGSAGSPVYPNANFDNVQLEDEPYIDLPDLENKYKLRIPTYLGDVTVTNNTVTAETGSEGCFDNVAAENYLLYRLSGEGSGDADMLRVLGYIQTKTDGDEVILSDPPPSETNGQILEVFSWEGAIPTNGLKELDFTFSDNFYMLVKNVDYTTSSGKHDGVLYINTALTNYTVTPQPFAYSSSRIINPNFFSLQRISKVRNPKKSQVDATNIPCSIVGVSKWSELALFQNATIADDQIPYWSVYEINPKFNSTDHLDKNTFYRLVISDTLPTSKIAASVNNGGTGGTS